MNPKRNILIIGGTGFIGYHLAKKSLKKGWQVTSIYTKPPKKARYLPKVKYILCDITKKKIPADILAKIGQPKRVKQEGIPIVKYDLTPYGIFDDE